MAVFIPDGILNMYSEEPVHYLALHGFQLFHCAPKCLGYKKKKKVSHSLIQICSQCFLMLWKFNKIMTMHGDFARVILWDQRKQKSNKNRTLCLWHLTSTLVIWTNTNLNAFLKELQSIYKEIH